MQIYGGFSTKYDHVWSKGSGAFNERSPAAPSEAPAEKRCTAPIDSRVREVRLRSVGCNEAIAECHYELYFEVHDKRL